MKNLKFLHCADIHLDMPFTSLGAGTDKSAVRRQDLKQSFRKIIETAKERKVDVLLISGDLYEHNYIRRSTINFVNDMFSEIPDTRVFIIPGNHDPYTTDSYYKSFKWAKNVFVLSQDTPYVLLEDIGACIYGICPGTSYEDEPDAHGFKAFDRELINILLFHGTIDMNIGGDIFNPATSVDLDKLGMDYVALGHFHNRIEGAGSKRSIFNPGSPEPLGFDENGKHGVFCGSITKYDSLECEIGIDFIKLSKRFYEDIYINTNGCSTDEQVACKAMEAISGTDAINALLNVVLKGYTAQGYKINTSQVQIFLREAAFFVKIKDETAVDYNFEEIAREPGLRGLFTRTILAQTAKSEDAHERQLLTGALYYGIEALERGEVDIN